MEKINDRAFKLSTAVINIIEKLSLEKRKNSKYYIKNKEAVDKELNTLSDLIYSISNSKIINCNFKGYLQCNTQISTNIQRR